MLLSLFGISTSLFGIALILTSSGSATMLGLFTSFAGLIVSFVAFLLGEFKKVKDNLK